MPHELEDRYGLTSEELLDALNARFRARVALEGAVAEVHLEKKLRVLLKEGAITKYESYDLDGYPDFEIWIHSRQEPLRIECKSVRDSKEAYRAEGKIIAYKVETQKTRASKSDKGSRYYDVSYFDILAVCLGKKTGNWTQFLFCRTVDLQKNSEFPGKLDVMQRVPLPERGDLSFWYHHLGDLLSSHY